MKNATAKLMNLRMTPRKVRLVVDVVRGLPVREAEAQLMMMKKRASLPVLKLLRSAIANAKELKLDGTKLAVSLIRVDQGTTLKRILPRAKGSASPIHKMASHVTITLSESAKEIKERFVMIPREKKKETPKRVTKSSKRKTAEARNPEKKTSEDPGFMRRVFRRKSG